MACGSPPGESVRPQPLAWELYVRRAGDATRGRVGIRWSGRAVVGWWGSWRVVRGVGQRVLKLDQFGRAACERGLVCVQWSTDTSSNRLRIAATTDAWRRAVDVLFACPYCSRVIRAKNPRPGRYKPKCPKCQRAFVLVVPAESSSRPVTELIPDDTVVGETSEPPTVKMPPVDPNKRR